MFAEVSGFYGRNTRGENLPMSARAAALSLSWECGTSVVAASEAASRTSSDLSPLEPPVWWALQQVSGNLLAAAKLPRYSSEVWRCVGNQRLLILKRPNSSEVIQNRW